MQKYLVLKGIAGLGNRLCTLANAIDYAQKTGRTLMVDWSDGIYGMMGQNVFYHYFKLNDIPFITSITEIPATALADSYPSLLGEHPTAGLYDIYMSACGNISRKIIPNRILKGAISKIHKYWHPKEDPIPTKSDIQAIKAVFNRNDIPFGGNYGKGIKQKTLFFADTQPRFSDDTVRKNISLSDEMQTEVNLMAEQIGIAQHVVGVHVRMTDLQPKAPLTSLTQKIDKMKLNSHRIFLATDNEQIEEYFKQRYQNVIFMPKHRMEYADARTGIHHRAVRTGDYSMAETVLKESIIDMWLLSKCEYLFCQGNSSFSKIAAILKNQPEKTFVW
jgi:hypothetical protein